ncbi:SDR family oxidoreductase [Paramicrobacterium fandaimingii]|uniref:SDR family oxidoreductase n=1 Tax=Paramicrobacterium fandaimingii TaxID=2708079 RepID=UPI001422A1C7|nr:SDR family oxidoreductase [Microbacterium fandaimingii]
MIIVTGATGVLGGKVVDHLLESVAADRIAVAVRDVSKAQRFADRGIDVRRADYSDRASLTAAFAGGDQLFLVSSSDPTADAVTLHRNAIDAAVAAGIGRVLYTSHQGAHPQSPFAPAQDHAATEWMLEESGLAWTSLRNGFYAHSLEFMLGAWRETGIIEVPSNGPVSWTAREDAAEAAAAILASDGRYDGPVTLTARSAPTFDEIAMIASEIAGRSIRVSIVDPDEWVAGQVAAGTPEGMAHFTLGIYQAAAGGYFAGVDPTLGELLGREPRSVRDLLTSSAS